MRSALYSGLSLLLPLVASHAHAAQGPEILISVSTHVLVLRHGDGREERFPVATGRRFGTRYLGPRGTWFTGPDPRDLAFYLPHRRLPAYHQGLPFLRLSPVVLKPHRTDPAYQRAALQPFGIHGRVTPSLIWGAVTAGCVRMRPRDLYRVFAFCKKHPGIRVRYTRSRFSLQIAHARRGCPEAARGIRRLRRVSPGRYVHERICGGVDHWFSIELQGGDVISVDVQHGGRLRLELFGIRAISAVSRGSSGIRYRVPVAQNNRGARYLRIVAPRRGSYGYTLIVRRLR